MIKAFEEDDLLKADLIQQCAEDILGLSLKDKIEWKKVTVAYDDGFKQGKVTGRKEAEREM